MLKLTLILIIVESLVFVAGSGSCAGRNEYYEKCASTCNPQTCDSIGKTYHCPKMNDCVGACRCISGFYRDSAGVCISEEQCYNQMSDESSSSQDDTPPPAPTPPVKSLNNNQDLSSSSAEADATSSASSSEEVAKVQIKPKCGLNEVYDLCPAPCPPRRCDVDERVIRCKSPPKVGDKECVPGCRCADNYYRNNDGACVLKSQCPTCLGKDEVYEYCPRSCPPQTCESLWSTAPCPIRPAVCIPSCRCKPDMYRNKLGECISKQDCLKCRGPHEYFTCGGACDNECDKLSRQNQTSCPIINITCNRKCYCEPGYARNVDNICVPIAQCPPECKVNEVYVKNVKAIGRPTTCSESVLGLMEYEKANKSKPTPGCVCAEGYARNHDGRCIPTEECYADVGVVNFDKLDTNQTEVVMITAVAYFVPSPVCGANEVMSDCINTGCDKLSCSDLATTKNCLFSVKKCDKGCRCKDNYLRDKNGICIPIDDCPAPKCPGRDEVYEKCPKTCPPQTCRGLQAKYKCPANATIGCKPSCRCKPNMYRNDHGECITKQQCTQCKANEMYIRNINEWNRPKTCAELHGPRPNLPVDLKSLPVRPGCVCAYNYVRNDQGTCIPIKECPPQCGVNEIYVNNTRADCQPQKCSQLGYPLECEMLEDYNNYAEPGCICKGGYLRDDNGQCIPAEKCPSCGGDPNAMKGCGVYCNTCDTLRNGPRPCPRICVRNGCNCKKNYIFDETQSRCVLPQNCGRTLEPYYLL
ncbi:unnamed protein product [Colias eurytheme]|nr:unnamed protein product [Colias eurytheme]